MAFDQTKSPGAVTENRSWAVTAVSPPRTAETKMPQEDFFPFCGRWVTSILKAAPNRPILHFFLKHHHVGEPSEGWATLQDSLLGGLGYLGILPHNAQGDIVTKLKRPCCFSVVPAGIKAGSAPCGASCGICSPPYPHNSGVQGPADPRPWIKSPLHPEPFGQHLLHPVPTEALPPLKEEGCSECQTLGGGLPRGHEGSVPIEFFQDCWVGVFKQPLLGERGWVAGVHEDPMVTFTAVHAAATDRVVQGLVL